MINAIATAILVSLVTVIIFWNAIFIIDDLKRRKRDKDEQINKKA